LLAYVRVRPNPGQLPRVADAARAMPEVIECHRVTGEDCFVVKLLLPEMAQLGRVLDHFLRFGTTITSIVQSSPVQPRTPPLPE
jgi:Lrp/AsnC family leucine-responsive transcriptional regulator